jgi:hypothetical protein
MADFMLSRLTVPTLPKLGRWAGSMAARSFPTVSHPQQKHNFTSRRLIVKRIAVLLFFIVFRSAAALQAQAPAPQPDPALKELSALVGHWTFDGEQKPGPLGPGGKSSGEFDGQMILGGFFFQGRQTKNGALGNLVIWGYNAVNRNFEFDTFSRGGTRMSGVVTVSGNTFTWAGKVVAAGKSYPVRGRIVVAADLMGGTETGEISPDANTWTPFFENRYTKDQPAPKR